jgi:hypothetical protein
MKRSRFSWVLWGVFVTAGVAAATLKLVYAPRGANAGNLPFDISLIVAFAVFATVGAIILSRRPRHAIGGIYLLGAVAAAVGELASALTGMDPSISRAVWWVGDFFSQVPLVVLVAFPLLLFPHGTLPSRRWRILFRVAIAGLVLVAARDAVLPGPFNGDGRNPTNPLGIPGAKALIEGLSEFGILSLGLVVLAAIVSLFVRFRRSSGAEREQLKWLGWAGVWTLFLLFMAGPGTYGASPLYPGAVAAILLAINPYLFAFAFAVIPLFTAVAILRYRLYDIDRIISRTLSYAIITAVLGGLFVLVALVPTVIVGSDDAPNWTIVVATILVAAAFRPVRRRVQGVVDRRFNRARYDAAHTIEGFSARLREEIDLDTLRGELHGVVDRTMRPEHVFLWLPTTRS